MPPKHFNQLYQSGLYYWDQKYPLYKVMERNISPRLQGDIRYRNSQFHINHSTNKFPLKSTIIQNSGSWRQKILRSKLPYHPGRFLVFLVTLFINMCQRPEWEWHFEFSYLSYSSEYNGFDFKRKIDHALENLDGCFCTIQYLLSLTLFYYLDVR